VMDSMAHSEELFSGFRSKPISEESTQGIGFSRRCRKWQSEKLLKGRKECSIIKIKNLRKAFIDLPKNRGVILQILPVISEGGKRHHDN
jgi:hypothetical protein